MEIHSSSCVIHMYRSRLHLTTTISFQTYENYISKIHPMRNANTTWKGEKEKDVTRKCKLLYRIYIYTWFLKRRQNHRL